MTPEELEIVEGRAIALQDKRGRIAYAKQQGRLSEAIAFVMHLLKQDLRKKSNHTPSVGENGIHTY